MTNNSWERWPQLASVHFAAKLLQIPQKHRVQGKCCPSDELCICRTPLLHVHLTRHRLPIPQQSAGAGVCDQVNKMQSNTML